MDPRVKPEDDDAEGVAALLLASVVWCAVRVKDSPDGKTSVTRRLAPTSHSAKPRPPNFVILGLDPRKRIYTKKAAIADGPSKSREI
ncbi:MULTISPECIES: hypothetical protein [unclassified Rhizobium]|uniref:hypothetical protein n=1 Tax=unclassified Rhizobium TaxID=2613769 RepID=UPI001192B739|nr:MULTISPECIES: hypothetical protein [unclassified Rhizobium]